MHGNVPRREASYGKNQIPRTKSQEPNPETRSRKRFFRLPGDSYKWDNSSQERLQERESLPCGLPCGLWLLDWSSWLLGFQFTRFQPSSSRADCPTRMSPSRRTRFLAQIL